MRSAVSARDGRLTCIRVTAYMQGTCIISTISDINEAGDQPKIVFDSLYSFIASIRINDPKL